MSTITQEFTKEQLIEHIKGRKEFADECAADSTLHPERREYYELTAEALRIALASLEAEPVAWAHRLVNKRNGVVHPWVYGSAEASPSEGDIFNIEVMPLYSAPPAPVSVPDLTALDNLAGEMLNHAMNCERRVAVAYTHCAHRLAEEVRDLRAAMLQGGKP